MSWKNYFQLINRHPRLYWLLGLTILSIVGSFFVAEFTLLSFLFFFCFIDVVGYVNLHDKGTSALAAYRILQATIQVALLVIIALAVGIWYALAAELIHWFGCVDLLYYWAVKVKLPKVWSWLGWTPLGIIKGDITNTEMLVQCFVGLLFVILIILGINL